MRGFRDVKAVRWAVFAAGGALALAGLTGCAGPGGEEGPAVPAGGGEPAGHADETGTVAVTFASGGHAGSYEGSGSLKCGHGDFVPDGWWLVFASDVEDDQPDVVNIMNFWLAPEAEVDNPDSPYPGDRYLFNLWLGNPYLDGAKFDVSGEDGGTVTLDGVDGDTVRFSGETAAGEAFSVVATCPVIATE